MPLLIEKLPFSNLSTSIPTVTLTTMGPGGPTRSVTKTISFGTPVVTSVKSKYADNVFYMDGIDHNVTYTATVDWAGKEPGTVRFIITKPSGDTIPSDVLATGTTASKEFNEHIPKIHLQ